MSIYKINNNLPNADKIEDLNDMTIEVNGKVSQGTFNKNEVDDLYALLPIDRKYLRNQLLGHTLATYSGFTHLKAESGYSIWKYSPTNYQYNSLNQFYFDDKLIVNKGEATSESATAFTSVFLYNGDSGSGYTDDTAEAATEGGTAFELMDSINDYLYLGIATSTFSGAKFEFATRGSNYTLKVEYWNGAWTQLTANTNDLDDNTSGFESDAIITWTTPNDWVTTTVNSVSSYWVRFSTTTAPVTTATCNYLIPGNSVIALLALSSTEIQNEEWAWCSYTTAVYFTIRNTGSASYEGSYFITSASTASNLQNFFIYNHEYKGDYKDSTYNPVITKTSDYIATGSEGAIVIDASVGNVTITLPSAYDVAEGKEILIKVLTIGSGFSAIVDAESGETIDGSANYTFVSDYDYVKVMSTGTTWIVTGK